LAGQFAAQLAAATAPGNGSGGSAIGSTVIQPAASAPTVHHGPAVILPNAATPVNPPGTGQPVTAPGDQVVGTTSPQAPVAQVIGTQTNPLGTAPDVLHGGTAPTGNAPAPGSPIVPGTGAAGPDAPGTASDLLHGGSAQPVPGVSGSSAMDSRRHDQGDSASQVPDKTPEFVIGLPTPAQPVSGVDPSLATAVSQPGLPTPAEQVAMRLVPLRRGADGIHRMTIHLNPDDLGPISVVAEVRGGAIAVQLHSATEAGRAALQASLPDLRQNLIDGGFGSCALDLQQGDQGQSQPQPQPNWSQSERRPAPGGPAPVEASPVAGPESQSALDLRI